MKLSEIQTEFDKLADRVKPNYIRVFCSECKPPHNWPTVTPDRVMIILDLKHDHYIYQTECPHCGHHIHMTRGVYRP